MRQLFLILSVLSVILTILLGLGLAVGALVHWLLPAIDFGIAALIGVIGVGYALHVFREIASSKVQKISGEDDIDPDDMEDMMRYYRNAARRARRQRTRTRRTE